MASSLFFIRLGFFIKSRRSIGKLFLGDKNFHGSTIILNRNFNGFIPRNIRYAVLVDNFDASDFWEIHRKKGYQIEKSCNTPCQKLHDRCLIQILLKISSDYCEQSKSKYNTNHNGGDSSDNCFGHYAVGISKDSTTLVKFVGPKDSHPNRSVCTFTVTTTVLNCVIRSPVVTDVFAPAMDASRHGCIGKKSKTN